MSGEFVAASESNVGKTDVISVQNGPAYWLWLVCMLCYSTTLVQYAA